MEKDFNVTGTCVPAMHYMVNIAGKLQDMFKFVDKGKYFTINRPRQYGKTTTMYMLENLLNSSEEYLAISISFEGIGDIIFEKEDEFSKVFVQLVADSLAFEDEELSAFMEQEKCNVEGVNELSRLITKLCRKSDKKLVLMIDEVDKSSNNQLFLSFLGMLRNKYLLRAVGKDFTFHSVILAGVHDVKSLKLKIRDNSEEKYNSPWNIAADFEIDMSFSVKEIETMLTDYENTKGVVLDKDYFAERLRYYTSGYPFLVSKLCKIIDESIMPQGQLKWKKEYMDLAVKQILKEGSTNFDSLIKNIENHEQLAELVNAIVLQGRHIAYIKTDEVIDKASIYGIIKQENGICKINNRIYEQLIYNHMMMKVIRRDKYGIMEEYNYKDNFIRENGKLDMNSVLLKFQQFMKHEYSNKRAAFLEEDGRLLFLAFMSPILNGTGFAFKEVKGGEEKRFDVVITYNNEMYILELKIWRGQEYHKRGLLQLESYLNQYGLNSGHLLVFDFRKETGKAGECEEIVVGTKNIFVTYC